MPGMTPEEILQIHKDYADQFASLAQSGLQGAFSALSGGGIFNYHPAGINIVMPSVGEPNPIGNLPNLPIDPVLPKNPDVITKFKDIPNDNVGSAPNPTYGSVPVFTMPAAPPQVRDFYEVAPANPVMPTMPVLPPYLTLPSTVLPYPTVNIPTAPMITNPAFDGRRPNDIALPDPITLAGYYITEQNAHRNMLPGFLQSNADALITKYAPEFPLLRKRINDAITAYTDPVNGGGNSIPANIENAILARATDRSNMEYQRALDSTADTLAKKGYTIPPGALLAALRNARTAMGDAQVKSSTDVATKNFDLEQQNFQFMLKLGEALEEKMLDVVSGYMKLALEIDAQSISSAKELVGAYIGAYNVQALIYRAMWDGYVADAEVLKARIAANESLVRQFEAQIDAALAPLEVARIQTAIFEAKARAYSSEVSAYEARWRGFASQVEGELGKFKGFDSAVQGFVGQVQGYREGIAAYTAQINAASETNKAYALTNDSKVRTYTAQADAAIKVYDGQIAGYSAASNVIVKQAEIEVEFWRTKANFIFQEYNVAVQQMFEYAREQMNLFRGQMEAAINAANGLAHASQVAGNLAGQAMGGLTSFAGVLESREA